ncbi:uncharacterized protein LOC135132870 [Zophobas morio]|uniref:uncharacterized protein LOC135132870 n=1 Tax=Zophobas morio TaxID=2755281 RepID=UPI0030831589
MSTNLEDLLQTTFQHQTIATHKQTGTIHENHTTIASLEVVLNDGTTLNIAAKTLPESPLFAVLQASLQKEINFYNIVAPTLQYFQEREDVDELYFLPASYGTNLSQSTILLENLKCQGYENVDERLNLGTTRQVLKDLASFHAIPLALKLKDPKVFDTKVKRYLSKAVTLDYSQAVLKIVKIVEEESEFESYLDRIKEKLEEVPEKALRAPFSTMIHSDCCLRNILVKNGDGTADIKLIDFQHCSYGSLADDLILFLYTSVQREVLEEHSNGLIEFYHSNLVRVLEECKCDPTPFSLDALLKEMKTVTSEGQFVHVLSVLLSLFQTKDSDRLLLKDRILFVVKNFVERKWI